MKKTNYTLRATSHIVLKSVCVLVFLLAVTLSTKAQPVNSYVFSSGIGSTSSVASTGTLLAGSNSIVDDVSWMATIPFTFYYHGAPFTTMGISSNGYVKMGAATTSTFYSPLLSITDCISMMGSDLYGQFTSHGIYTKTVGSAPNRLYIVEYYHWGNYSAGGNMFTFQLILRETSNVIQVAFLEAPGTGTLVQMPQVGLVGASYSDFNVRTTTTNWSATTTAANRGLKLTYSATVRPASNLIYTWSPHIVVSDPHTPIVMLTEKNNPLSFNLYPNPANDDITIDATSDTEKEVVIEFYDILGNKLSQQHKKLSAGNTLIKTSVDDLQKGMYFIRVSDTENNILYTQRMVKQ